MNLKDIDHKLTSKESDELRKPFELFFEYDSHAKLSCYIIVLDISSSTKNFFSCYDDRITVYPENHEIY